MGIVYLARDVALDRAVAIKLLPPDLARDAGARERFLREARTAAGLAHPHIVPIHLVEAKDDLVYFVMGYIEGETLGERVRRTGPLPAADAARIIREVAWALAYAHGRGIIHRDIKPDNILIDKGSGRALVTDFGIARVANVVSQSIEILGTLQFMSPEQADPGCVLDGRSDLYSLGATAFFALSGRLPFEAPSAPALIAMHLTEPAPPISTLRPDTPPRLAEAVDRCLAKDPAARFASAEAMAEALSESVALTKPVPPSALGVRDALNTEFTASAFMLTAYLWTRLLDPGAAKTVGVVALAVAGAGAIGIFGAARACVRAGVTSKEVADTFTALAGIRDANVEASRQTGRKLMQWFRHPIGRVITGGIGALYLWVAVDIFRTWLGRRGSVAELGVVAFMAFFGGGLSSIALQLGPFAKSRADSLNKWMASRREAWTRFIYDNSIMRAIFRIGGLGVKKPKATRLIEHAATEVLLGRAVNEMFDALPSDQRKRLAEVPDVLKRLERAASALRTRRDELARAIGEAGTSERGKSLVRELEAEQAAAAERLTVAVGAIENLRLDMLRLRAGVGTADDLTGSLEEAIAAGRAVDAQIAGRAEVERLIAP